MANTLLETFNSFLDLTVGKLDQGSCFSELFVQMGTFLSMTPAQMHFKSFGEQLNLMPKFFIEDTRVPPRIRDITPKRFSDDLQLFPEDAGVASRFGNICTKFLSQSIGKNLSLMPSIGNVSAKRRGNQLQFLPEDASVASGFGNVSSKRVSSRTDNFLNLRQRFLIHIDSVSKTERV
ncbi:MAG TPA: hypothetical protein VJ746_06170 [Nitrospira sp.]|nr:hypothetical protein [Nitrospira sp.]